MYCCPHLFWHCRRCRSLAFTCLLVGLSITQVASPSSNIRITSIPDQASVFGEQRGSLYFYGYTPLKMTKENMSGDKVVISKTGYITQRFAVKEQLEFTVELEKDEGIETIPDSLRLQCGLDAQKAYSAMADSFRTVPTMLKFDTPFMSIDIDDKKSLLIVARVIDRKTRADLRSTRRKDGINAFENKLEEQAWSVAREVINDIKKISCVDYVALRLIYSDAKLALDVKRIQVPWSQLYTYQQGSSTVYETKYGVRGENVSSIKISDGSDRFVDFFYQLQAE